MNAGINLIASPKKLREQGGETEKLTFTLSTSTRMPAHFGADFVNKTIFVKITSGDALSSQP
jgi:hypothetical protein